MRLQWINRDHDLIAKRTLWVRFHYYFKKKKKKGGGGQLYSSYINPEL